MLDRYDASASRPLSVSPNRWERGQRRRGEGSWSIRRPPRVVAGAGGKRAERDGARSGSSSLLDTTSAPVAAERSPMNRAFGKGEIARVGGTSNCAKVE